MTKFEFVELKKKYSTVTEAIKLYDSGNHSEYNEDLLNEQLDKIHEEICDAASEIAQYLIDKIDDAEDNGEKVKMTNKDWDNICYLERLGYMACNCRDHYYDPERFDLTKSYGNGYINSIGADFYVCSRRHSEYTRYGYRDFWLLLNEYELIID